MADEALRAECENLCERGLWKEAVAKYGAYIDLLLAERASDGCLVDGYSNRAEVFLQLKLYADALEDAESALNLDPQHLKSLVRKGNALEGLKLFDDVVATYTKLLLDRDDLSADQSIAIQDSLQDAITKHRQTRWGQFDDDDDWWKARKGSLEDFVGPVELRRASGGARGLFATRDVYPGELLFVASPITSVKHPKGSQQSFEVFSSLISGLDKRVRHARYNLKDFSQAQLLVQLDVLAGPYPAGPLSRDAPPMRFFTPVNAVAPHLRMLTTEDLQHPRFTAQFNTDLDMLLEEIRWRPNTCVGTSDEDVTGIYCLPCLINHSCLPNVSITYQSSVTQPVIPFFCRASRKIGEGDELFTSYQAESCPLEERRQISPNTICECVRCLLEDRLLKEIPDLRDLERTCKKLWVEKLWAWYFWAHEGKRVRVRNQCIKSVTSLKELLKCDCKLQYLPTTEKEWILAAFVRFCRLLLQPELALSPRSSQNDHLLQLRIILGAVRALRSIDPASATAMGMSLEALKQADAWLHLRTFEIMGEQTKTSAEISLIVALLHLEGKEIAQLIYGPQAQVNIQEVLRMFSLHGMPFRNMCGDRY